MELKNTDFERRIFLSRLLLVSVGLAALLTVIFSRLFHLQIVNYGHFTTKALENRIKIEPLVPTRGLIFSRDGHLLAGNRASFSLVVIPEKITDMSKSLSRLASKLGMDEAELKQNLVNAIGKKFNKHVLKTSLTEKEVAIFSVNRFQFQGFTIVPNLTRVYPLRDQMAHALGYVGRIQPAELKQVDKANYRGTRFIGKTGVEHSLETVLHGKAGYQRVEVNAEGRVIRIVERRDPVPGNNLYLTIDATLQSEAFNALNGKVGSVVAIDPNNGEVLVAVSNPSFDPNLFVGGITQKKYDDLVTSKGRKLFNRFLQGQYPPGSTIKPIIALGALEVGVENSDNHIFCPGFFLLTENGRPYRCWAEKGHGEINMETSIARSCDVYYYQLAQKFGIQGIHDSLKKFGLGKETGIDVAGEKSGLVPSASWKKLVKGKSWYKGETLISGIGQGFMLTTPMQLAHATSILATKGNISTPHFLNYAQSGVEKIYGELEVRKLVLKNKENWDVVRGAMVEVIHGKSGTARSSKLDNGILFAGKTGTAQVSSVDRDLKRLSDEIPIHLRDHALFIGYAPAENPKIAIAVVVENGGSGSRVAAPIAKRVIDKFFVRQSNSFTSSRE